MRIFEKSTDPFSGMTTTYGAEDGKLVMKYEQDVSPSLDYATTLRNSSEYSRAGIKRNHWHCVHVPESVIMQMLTEDGFDFLRSHARECRQFLSRNKDKYGYLFTTGGKF